MLDGIILKKQPYQETSELLTLFTREHGKLNILAKGSLKVSSPLFIASQLYIHGAYDVAVRSNLSLLYSGERRTTYTINTDLLAQVGYAYMAELMLYCFDERIAIPTLYEWFIEGYTLLQNENYTYYVLAKTLYTFQVYIDEPLVYNACAHCKERHPIVGFSFENRGFICQNCKAYLTHPVKTPILRAINTLTHAQALTHEQMEHPIWKSVFITYQTYFKDTLGIIPKSGHILKQL